MAGKRHKCLIGLLLGVIALAAVPSPSSAADVSAEQVRAAVQKGIAQLRSKQDNKGGWGSGASYGGGNTALAVLAMLNSGVSPQDPAVKKGIHSLRKLDDKATYVVSLKVQALVAAGAGKGDKDLESSVNWLVRTQLPTGMWTYTAPQKGRPTRGRGDNSITQFALLALHEASKAGIEIQKQVWQRSKDHFIKTQLPNGGWGYNTRMRKEPYGSMTTAGVASLYICGLRLHVSGPKKFVNGAYPSCGQYQQHKSLAKGIEWLTRNFSVKKNPHYPNNESGWLLYYLYGLERVGMIAGIQRFGEHDWYRKGADHLVRIQNKDGSWSGNAWGHRRGGNTTGPVYDTSFALLFLAKGNRPVLIQKLRWQGLEDPSWNRNIHDLENLTAFIGDKFGKQTTWQTASLKQSLRELRVSPLLYITGHEFPIFTAADRNKLQAYIESGGVLLFEACCGSKDFDRDFRTFSKQMWGRKGYELRKLEESHPVFSSYYSLKDISTTYDLHGVNTGCRTAVFYSPKALSCLWELEEIPTYSEIAFKLGTNIAAYATGKEQLSDKLDVVDLPSGDKDDKGEKFEIPRGAVRLARLYHNGDYNADPQALVKLARLMRDDAKIAVVSREKHIKATDEDVYEYPVLFMNGHYSFKMSDEEIESLRSYLTKGGFLVSSACCGEKAYDKSFREMVGKIFPERKLEKLPKDHTIFTGRKIGANLGELKFRNILAQELKKSGVSDWRGTSHPPLEVIKVDGRIVLVHSRYDWCCALEGDRPYSCRGYIDEDGQKLALNILLYAITN